MAYPRTTHVEQHFTGSATVRDVIIGMSDGLTVPFALAVVTLSSLLVFGGIKAHFTGVAPLRGAVQTSLVGAVAATVAYALARLVSGGH